MKKLTTLFAALLYSTAAFSQAGGVYTGPNQPGQIIGTGTNDNALVGNIGEYLSASVPSGSAIPLTTATPVNLTSLNLTPGDWDVSCSGIFLPAGTTQVFSLETHLSPITGARNQTVGNFVQLSFGTITPGVAYNVVALPATRVSISAPTVYYCVVVGSFGTSTLSVWGGMRARRVR